MRAELRAPLRRRYARQRREAVIRATACEILAIKALDNAVNYGHMTVDDASHCLRSLIREQHTRTMAQAA